MKNKHLVVLVAVLALSSFFAVHAVLPRPLYGRHILPEVLANNGISDVPSPKDIVTVTVHDKQGNLIEKQTTNNIITTAGAAFYCIESGMCLGGAGGAIINPNLAFVNAAPTYWVQFVNGTVPNTNEPTASDCGLASDNSLAGDVVAAETANAHCITSFGPTGQYPSGSNNFAATLCINAVSCTGDLRAAAGKVNTTAISTLGNRVFGPCTPDSNGTAPASGTCENSIQTNTFTNNISEELNIVGLALYSGSSSAVTTGPIMVAEAQITPVTLNPGDTIQVTWQITI